MLHSTLLANAPTPVRLLPELNRHGEGPPPTCLSPEDKAALSEVPTWRAA